MLKNQTNFEYDRSKFPPRATPDVQYTLSVAPLTVIHCDLKKKKWSGTVLKNRYVKFDVIADNNLYKINNLCYYITEKFHQATYYTPCPLEPSGT